MIKKKPKVKKAVVYKGDKKAARNIKKMMKKPLMKKKGKMKKKGGY